MSAMFKYFKSLFVSERKLKIKQTSPEEELTLRLKPYERHLYKIQDIIVWKDCNLSCASVVLVNLVFWFISYFEWRFFGFFFTLLSTVLFHDAWVNYIWPEIRVKEKVEPKKEDTPTSDLQHEGLLSLPELSRYATELQSVFVKRYKRLKQLRTTQPAVFCVVSSAGCLFLAGLGSFLSGMALLYLISLAVLTLPGVYIHLVTPQQKEVIRKILQSLYSIILPPDNIQDDVDEYMPDTSKENLDILTKAGNNSNDLSTPSSESSMVDLIPCVEESSLDSFTLPPGGDSDDSEGDLSFKNSHFNGSSSGEDLAKDLTFPEVRPALASALLTGVFYKTFPAISGRLQFSAAGDGIPPPTEENDSDSEFEFIDEDS